MKNTVSNAVVFQIVHHVSTITLIRDNANIPYWVHTCSALIAFWILASIVLYSKLSHWESSEMHEPLCLLIRSINITSTLCNSVVVYLDLLIRSNSTEHNLCKLLRGKHSEADASDNPVFFDKSEWMMFSMQIKIRKQNNTMVQKHTIMYTTCTCTHYLVFDS